jgi:Fe-S oxidoreductase
MAAIGEIDAEARRVRVGPGVVQEDLNRAAQRLGLGFGPDTSTSNRATIGGMIGNTSGSHSIVYGTTIDHVHELEVVLADGSTAKFGPTHPNVGPPAIVDGLHEILDLCLECKACKSECPLSVDMASLKAEFLSHYQDAHGVPLRSRLFGSIRTLNRLGSAAAPLSNLAPRGLLERVAGIDRRRPLPRFARDTLIRWDRQRAKATGRELAFLADSFTTYTEPAVGRAAIELLEAAGYAVRLESGGCCGWSSISKGLLDRAREMAAGMTERLAPYAERGVPIVGCEPSCLLTLREEHLSLQPGNARAEAVAREARLVDELLVEAIDVGREARHPVQIVRAAL